MMFCSKACTSLRHAFIAVVVCLLGACGSNAVHPVPAQVLMGHIDAGNPMLVVDVRSRGEYAKGRVPGAIHLPFYDVWSRLEAVTSDRNRTVVLYCAHGPRAGWARLTGRFSDFEQITILEGHMTGWRRQGLPIEVGFESAIKPSSCIENCSH